MDKLRQTVEASGLVLDSAAIAPVHSRGLGAPGAWLAECRELTFEACMVDQCHWSGLLEHARCCRPGLVQALAGGRSLEGSACSSRSLV